MHRIVNHVLGERLDRELRAVAPESEAAPAFTIETFAQYVIHDPMHHLWDVRADATGSAVPST